VRSSHNNLGVAYTQQEKWEEAIREYQAALSINPLYKEAARNLEAALKQKPMQ